MGSLCETEIPQQPKEVWFLSCHSDRQGKNGKVLSMPQTLSRDLPHICYNVYNVHPYGPCFSHMTSHKGVLSRMREGLRSDLSERSETGPA